MSAYGAIKRASEPLVAPKLLPRSYALPKGDNVLTVFPVRRETVTEELITYLQGVFNAVVEEGRTYPQMGVQSFEEFAGYFFGGDCFLGVLDPSSPAGLSASTPEIGIDREETYTLDKVVNGRSWEEAVLGMFYIKPNYPGRSSHKCNGGFVVPSVHRGLKVGLTLGRSFLHFAPLLGYRGSVFNLVYVSNVPSVRIWDQLGFQRAGLIPEAGALRTGVDSEGNETVEYVDAIVFHYDFTQKKLE